jgi:hypothetical protein
MAICQAIDGPAPSMKRASEVMRIMETHASSLVDFELFKTLMRQIMKIKVDQPS